MIVALAHLQQDPITKVWSYRRKFLTPLRPFVPSATGRGRTEFKVSLRVKNMNEPGATERHLAAQREFASLVAQAEKARAAYLKRSTGAFDTLDAPTIAALAARYHAQELTDDDARRRDQDAKATAVNIARRMQEVGHEFPSVPEAAEWTLGIRTAHKAIREAGRALRAHGDMEGIVSAWCDVAASLAADAGYELKPGGPSIAALCEALNDAAVQASEDALRRLDGDAVPTPNPLALPKRTNSPEKRTKGLALRDLFEQYAVVPGRHPKTIAQWRPYIAHLAKFVDDDDVRAITHDHIVAWRNHLRDHETYRGRPLSAKTINGSYLGSVAAVFAWAKGDNIISNNPMLEVTKVRLPSKPKTREDAFTTDEAATILRASLVREVSREGVDLQNAKRWCPWLMAYSGARVNEVTQLRKEDIFEKDGITVMRLTPDAGTIKSRKFRLVPLHSHLIAQGFLAFVKGRPSGPLFFDPSKRRSDNAIKRRLNEQIDLPDRLASLFIQFCSQNGGRLSARKREQYFPGLSDQEVERLEDAITPAAVPKSDPSLG